MKFIKFIILLLTLTCCNEEKRVFISIPNNYEGKIVIKEDKDASYYEPAFENFNVYEYKTNKFGVLKVKNISIFKNWNNVSFGFFNVTPVYKVNKKAKTGDFIISEPVYFTNKIEAIVVKK